MVIVAPTTQQPIIRTARLELRPFLPDDASRVMELAGAREIAETEEITDGSKKRLPVVQSTAKGTVPQA